MWLDDSGILLPRDFVYQYCRYHRARVNISERITVEIKFFNMEYIMSKSQDSKKAVKKEPAKTMKEKKADKKVKKEEKKRP